MLIFIIAMAFGAYYNYAKLVLVKRYMLIF